MEKVKCAAADELPGMLMFPARPSTVMRQKRFKAMQYVSAQHWVTHPFMAGTP